MKGRVGKKHCTTMPNSAQLGGIGNTARRHGCWVPTTRVHGAYSKYGAHAALKLS